jgi:hypothetical protein
MQQGVEATDNNELKTTGTAGTEKTVPRQK